MGFWQDGVPADLVENIKKGWQDYYWGSLEDMLKYESEDLED
jgi:hypothetical protein